MREVERQVMLRIIDQRWREHLYEMDYLQEGINLRAMGQKDPLTEWQREGFEMFGAMMKGIAQDFVSYVMHVQVVRNEAPAPPSCRTCSRRSSDDAPTQRRSQRPPPAAAASPARSRRRRAAAAGPRRSRAGQAADRSSRTSGRRPRATRRARAAAARSSSSATAHGRDRDASPRTARCVTSPTT